MNRWALCIAILLVSACQQAYVPGPNAAVLRVQQTTLPSGWRVDCLTDEIHGTKRCFAGTFGDGPPGTSGVPFQVVFYDGHGPVVEPGFNTFPGREPTVRVDENPPIYDMGAVELIEQMKSGRVARAEYHVWPRGAERVTVDLTGFEEAYALLVDMASPR